MWTIENTKIHPSPKWETNSLSSTAFLAHVASYTPNKQAVQLKLQNTSAALKEVFSPNQRQLNINVASRYNILFDNDSVLAKVPFDTIRKFQKGVEQTKRWRWPSPLQYLEYSHTTANPNLTISFLHRRRITTACIKQGATPLSFA